MIIDQLREPYKKHDINLHRSRLGFLIIISIIFIMMFSALDIVMYDMIAKDLIAIRVVVVSLLFFMLFINYKRWLLNAKLMSFAWSVTIIFLINMLIMMTNDKSSSPYYAGLNLIIVASAALLPWAWHEMFSICAVMLLSYTASCFITMDSANDLITYKPNLPILINNLFFLFSTSSFCILATYVNSKLRFKEFCLNHELKNAINQLRSTQTQLVQSEKINAIGSMAAGLLHEVNNPLNYTMMAIQMIKINPVVIADDDLQDVVKDVEEGMSRIKTIVTDLRAFAYPEEADKQNKFSIQGAVVKAMRFTSEDCNDIEIISNINPELVVIGSETHIVQLLINLISNAARAISRSKKKGLITIDARPENNRVIVSVTDNGCGMSQETLKRVFDPFFTTNEVGKGMGIGLSVSYTIAKNHGGNIIVTSEENVGTTFSFDLSC
jgi:two-component system sensor histidine kinase PhcS